MTHRTAPAPTPLYVSVEVEPAPLSPCSAGEVLVHARARLFAWADGGPAGAPLATLDWLELDPARAAAHGHTPRAAAREYGGGLLGLVEALGTGRREGRRLFVVEWLAVEAGARLEQHGAALLQHVLAHHAGPGDTVAWVDDAEGAPADVQALREGLGFAPQAGTRAHVQAAPAPAALTPARGARGAARRVRRPAVAGGVRARLAEAAVLLGTVACVALVYWLGAQVFGDGPRSQRTSLGDGVLFRYAGYAFAIWTPIYAGFLALALLQAHPRWRERPALARARPWLLGSAAVNAAWMAAAYAERMGLTLVAMAALLVLSVGLHRALGLGGEAGLGTGPGRSDAPAGLGRWVRAPFSLYVGWLTFTAFGNVTGVLVRAGWGGLGVPPLAWAALLVVAATGLGLCVRRWLQDAVYGGAVVWALVALAVGSAHAPLVSALALAGAVLVASTLLPPSPPRSRRSVEEPRVLGTPGSSPVYHRVAPTHG
jgi:hypothetical protein